MIRSNIEQKNIEEDEQQQQAEKQNQQRDESQAASITQQSNTTDQQLALQHAGTNEQLDDSNNRSKRNPFCSRCRNHGKSAQVKGHKRHCEYRDCQCEGCKLVECRQIVSAAQIKRRRYQKQDEECGRRIEISPPVLKRPHLSADGDQANDPVTLITKTLIGSASAKQLQQHQQHQQATMAVAQKQLVAAAAGSHHQHRLHAAHLPGLQQAAAAANFAAAAASSSSSLTSTKNQQHQQTNNQPAHPLHATHLNLNLNRRSPLPSSAGLAGPPSSSTLSNAALHLLHFPSSVLSAAASLSGPLKPHPSALITTPAGFTAGPFTDSNTLNNPASLPNSREQISLVEEIHQIYGPLAVYAWLRAEHFDLQKIRETIESSRISYNNLLDSKSIYRHTSINENHVHNNINVEDDDSDRADMKESQRNCSADVSSPIDKTNTLNSTMLTKQGSSSTNVTSATTIATAVPSTTPLHMIGSGYNSNYASNGNGSTFTTAAQRQQLHHINPPTTLTTSSHHLPISTAHSFFWPDLKLATSGSASMIHPHHLIPHFMHHPFLTQKTQHGHPQVSPFAVTHSSSSESSSSTVL